MVEQKQRVPLKTELNLISYPTLISQIFKNKSGSGPPIIFFVDRDSTCSTPHGKISQRALIEGLLGTPRAGGMGSNLDCAKPVVRKKTGFFLSGLFPLAKTPHL